MTKTLSEFIVGVARLESILSTIFWWVLGSLALVGTWFIFVIFVEIVRRRSLKLTEKDLAEIVVINEERKTGEVIEFPHRRRA